MTSGSRPLTLPGAAVLRAGALGIACTAALGSMAGGAYLYRAAITRAAPREDDETGGDDEVSHTMARLRAEGRAWLQAHSPEQMTCTAPDGTPLTGWLVPAREPARRLAVLVHGHHADHRLMGMFAAGYWDDGFDVFVADGRGHGQSGGKQIGMGWLDRLDCLGWLDVLLDRLGADTDVVLHGLSMGGATVLNAAAEPSVPPQVKAVVSDCSFSSVEDEFRYQVRELYRLPATPILTVADAMTRVLAGYSFKQASPLRQVRASKIPTLFVHGGIDRYNPTRMAHELHAAAGCVKELWIVPGADHAMALPTDPDAYWQRVRAFYRPRLTS